MSVVKNFKFGDCVSHRMINNEKRLWVIGPYYYDNSYFCLIDSNRYSDFPQLHFWGDWDLPKYFKYQFSITWCYEHNLFFHPDPIEL